jgi:hypothetical protein
MTSATALNIKMMSTSQSDDITYENSVAAIIFWEWFPCDIKEK